MYMKYSRKIQASWMKSMRSTGVQGLSVKRAVFSNAIANVLKSNFELVVRNRGLRNNVSQLNVRFVFC